MSSESSSNPDVDAKDELNHISSQLTTQPMRANMFPVSIDGCLRTAITHGQPAGMSLFHECMVILVCVFSQIFTLGGIAQIMVSQHLISPTFGDEMNPGNENWYIASFAITTAAFIPVAGRLGDIIGYKPVMIMGYIIYAIWATIGGLAHYTGNSVFFIICRSFQGVGTAFLQPTGLATLGKMYQPSTRKNVVFAIYGSGGSTGFILAAVFSALLAQRGHWPWAMYLTGIVSTVVAGIGYVVLPHEVDATIRRKRLREFDWFGSFFGTAALILVATGWTQSPGLGWSNAQPIVMVSVGVACFAAFGVAEVLAKDPILPFYPFRSSLMSGMILAVFCGWGAFGPWLFYLYQYLLKVSGETPLLATAHFAPIALTGVISAVTSGIMASKLHPTICMSIGLLLFLIMSVLLATIPDTSHWASAIVSTTISPWALSLTLSSATLVLSSSVSSRNQGIAAGIILLIANWSIPLNMAIAGCIISQLHPGMYPNTLPGVRDGAYYAMGSAGLGLIVTLAGVVQAVYIPFLRNRS